MIPRMGWSLLLLAGILLALGALLTAAVVLVMAWSLLRPPRMTDGKAAWLLQRLSPGDLGLAYEDVSYVVRDQRSGAPLRMRGWWIPRAAGALPGDRCVVLLHGYADAKVGAIAWAPVWHRLGFNILALDLRAHGESEGRESTAGYWERHDVDQVVSQLRAERPATTGRVVLFGASLGATVAAVTAALRDDVDAVVLDSPYVDFRGAAMTHMDLLGLPGGPLQHVALWLAGRMAGIDYDAVRTTDVLRAVRAAVLVIAPAEDVFLGEGDVAAFEAALAARPAGAGPGRVWRVEGANHLLGVHHAGDVYAQQIRHFLDESLPALPTNGVSAANHAAAGVNAGPGAV
jgi:pimeloyl-ACP methyl ester carboxylesterase